MNRFVFRCAAVVVASVASMVLAQEQAPRTSSYAGVMQGNLASEFTVDDYLARPHLIGDNQFLAGTYLSGVSTGNALIAFKAINLNWFGEVNADPLSQQVKVGFASGTTFGAGLMYTFKNEGSSIEGVSTTTIHHPWAGFGVFGSYNLMGNSLYGRISLADTLKRVKPESGTEVTDKMGLTEIKLGWTHDATGEKTHALNVELGINPVSVTHYSGLPDTLEFSQFSMSITANYGYVLKQSDEYSIFLGSALPLQILSTDQKIPLGNKTSGFDVSLRPNFAFQKYLGKGFEALCGASGTIFHWNTQSVTPRAVAPAVPATASGSSMLQTLAPTVALGLRWEKDNFAIDGQISNDLLKNGPDFISGAGAAAMFASVGVSLGF